MEPKKSFVAKVYEAVSEQTVATSQTDKNRIWIVFPFAAVMAFLLFIFTATNMVQADYYTALINGFFLSLCLIFLSRTLCSATLLQTSCDHFLLSLGIYFILHDWRTNGVMESWIGVVVVSDLMLLSNSSRKVTAALQGAIGLHLVLKCVEESAGFGYYSVFPYTAAEAEDGGWTSGAGWGVGLRIFALRMSVLIGDFVLTRRFAVGMREEREKVAHSIHLAERVASAMVRFDLDEAEILVGKGGDSDLKNAFTSLLANLRQYRPYLPDALFINEAYESQANMIETIDSSSASSFAPPALPPPGLDTLVASLVFTDIQASTKIWEAAQSGMMSGLKIHNQIMRRSIALYQGYEVKTIGDAFMVAFEAPIEACRFCLRAQEMLYRSEWPQSLMSLPECCEVEGAWRGLRVRMGVHCGEVEIEENPITGRNDYFGPTVNTAARVEGASVGGAIAVTEEVLREVNGIVQNMAVYPLGPIPLKGLAEKPMIALLVNSSINRLHDVIREAQNKWPSDCDVAENPLVPPAVIQRPPTPAATLQSQLTKEHCRTQLRKSNVTVMCINLSLSSFEGYPNPAIDVNNIVVMIVDCIERSEGVCDSVFSSTVVGTWNCSKRVHGHLSYGVRALGLLYNALRTYGTHNAHCGLSTGMVLHGNVGTASQRFVTVIGGSVELACALSREAKAHSTFALHTSMPGHPSASADPSLKYMIRPIDKWVLDTPVPQHITIFEFRVPSLSEFATYAEDDSGWSPEFNDAFEAGDYTFLRKYLATAGKCVLASAEPISPGFCIDYSTDFR